jgi:hypothetical protein
MVNTERGNFEAIEVGDKVAVPIGTVDVIGTVLEIYGTQRARRVLVEVPVHGSTGYAIEKRGTSYPISAVRTLRSLSVSELRSHLQRYRPVATSLRPGQAPPIWDWEPFEEVRLELKVRGLTDHEIDDLAWGWEEGADD